MGKNYYQILGVPKDADEAALKKVSSPELLSTLLKLLRVPSGGK